MCEAIDSRGVKWSSDFCSWATRDCPQGASGQARWYCDGFSGQFLGPEPDRVDCVETWIQDIKDKVKI